MADPVETIFPEGAIHLVGGPTGAGKTRWLLQTMLAVARGRPVLGYKSSPRPWVYISADRQEAEVWRTVDSMGLNRVDIPLLPAFAPLKTVGQIFDEAEQRGAQLLVWEGFGSYVGDGAGNATVRQWLSSLTYMLRHDALGRIRPEPLTIIGVVEQPKMKPNAVYANPRQRISGPAAWGHSASTIILVEHQTKDCTGPLRVLRIYPRDAAPIERQATLATGIFTFL